MLGISGGIVILIVVFFVEGLLASQQCLELGFNPSTLQCDTCESLSRVVGDEELYQDCSRCCASTNSDKDIYELAVVEVDKRFVEMFANLPDLLSAIPGYVNPKSKSKSKAKSKTTKSKDTDENSSKKALKNEVSYRYRFGASPSLHLYQKKDDPQPAETISITSWNVDDFVDFISSHVVLSSADSGRV